MALWRGFKKVANDYARSLRADMELQPHSPLCPWKLASFLEIPIASLSEFQTICPDAIHYLTKVDKKCFSAATVIHGYRRLIVHNDSHSIQRQASNICHELSHGILGHPPTEPFSEYGCRNFNQDFEDQADWLGPALLISEEAALHIVKQQISLEDAVNLYGATKEVIQMRLNVTAAMRRVNISIKKAS